jgi:HEAT repeat protein
VRLAAISALSAIGTDAVLRTLKAQVISFEAGPVRRMTVHVIAQQQHERDRRGANRRSVVGL